MNSAKSLYIQRAFWFIGLRDIVYDRTSGSIIDERSYLRPLSRTFEMSVLSG